MKKNYKLTMAALGTFFISIAVAQGAMANDTLAEKIRDEFVQLAQNGKILTFSLHTRKVDKYIPIVKNENGTPLFSSIVKDRCMNEVETKKFISTMLKENTIAKILNSHPKAKSFKEDALSGKFRSCSIFDSEYKENPENGAGVFYAVLVNDKDQIHNLFALPAGWDD